MARPLKTGLDYFPHDTDAWSDDKIEIMRSLFGNDGYAFYFILLEFIYHQGKGIECSSKDTINMLIKRIRVRPAKFNKMLEKSLEISLFDKESFEKNKELKSYAIDHRYNKVVSNRNYMREHRDLLPTNPITNSPQTPESKVKESKVNKTEVVVNTAPNILQSFKKEEEQTPELTVIVKCYESNIGLVTPMIADSLKEISEHFSPEWFERAVKEALNNNVRRLNYITSILERWGRDGLPNERSPSPKDKFKERSEELFKLPDGFITPGTNLNTALEIAEGRKEANKVNFNLICNELDRRGVKYNKKEFNASK
jgi:DnaD/phage-associated family protein